MVSLSDEFYAARLYLDGWKLWYSARRDEHIVAGPTLEEVARRAVPEMFAEYEESRKRKSRAKT